MDRLLCDKNVIIPDLNGLLLMNKLFSIILRNIFSLSGEYFLNDQTKILFDFRRPHETNFWVVLARFCGPRNP